MIFTKEPKKKCRRSPDFQRKRLVEDLVITRQKLVTIYMTSGGKRIDYEGIHGVRIITMRGQRFYCSLMCKQHLQRSHRPSRIMCILHLKWSHLAQTRVCSTMAMELSKCFKDNACVQKQLCRLCDCNAQTYATTMPTPVCAAASTT